MTLDGKTALVTGGTRGIGAAIARRLAQDGAAVAITYASSTDIAESIVGEIRRMGRKALAVKADAGSPDAVKAAVERTARELGKIDVLVNNAGIALIAPIETFPLADFEKIFAVNVRGPFVAIQAVLPHMPDGGRIINIGSINSDSVPVAGLGPYAMSKAALAGLTRAVARDLAPRKITVNNVQPGPIDTDMNPDQSEFSATLKKIVALGRYGTAEEVASLVAYLAGPEASYITGTGLKIDGGWDA